MMYNAEHEKERVNEADKQGQFTLRSCYDGFEIKINLLWKKT